MELPIDKIVVRDRTRTEMRNIASLANSIRETGGPLHPPVVRADGKYFVLVAGARRLAAMRQLGYDRVTVTVAHSLVDELSALRAEGEENTEREPFTPSEAVAHAKRIEVVIARQAKERMAAAGRAAAPGRPSERCAESAPLSPLAPMIEMLETLGKTRDQVAKAVGMSHPKLAEARTVVDAATDETLPEPVRKIAKDAVTEMDRTGNVHGAARKVEIAKAAHSPLNQYLANDNDLNLTSWRYAFAKALAKANEPVRFEIEHVAMNADEELIEQFERVAARLTERAAQCRQQWAQRNPAGLRLVKGA